MTRAGDKLYRDPEPGPPKEGWTALQWLAIVVLTYGIVRIVLTKLL